jgi:hypothetical protein
MGPIYKTNPFVKEQPRPLEDDAHNATDGTKMKNIDSAGK